jgi:hypothetical protein
VLVVVTDEVVVLPATDPTLVVVVGVSGIVVTGIVVTGIVV